jgi:methionine-rich copper-binding protein CopC
MKAKALLLVLGVFFAAGAVHSDPVHFELRSSVPAKDASVTSPREVRLSFTEPAENVGIRLVDAAGEVVETTEPAQDPQDSRIFFVAVGRTLVAGKYTVAWRGMGEDGHPLTGEFGFTVHAE